MPALPPWAIAAWSCWPTCRTPGPPDYCPSGAREIRAVLDRHEMAISNINGFMMNAVADPRQPYWHPSWIEPDRHYRAIRREHTKAHSSWPRTWAGRRSRPNLAGRWKRASSWQAAAAIFYDEIMPCVEVAEKLEVFLLIEPEPELLIQRFEQYLEFAGRIGSPG